MGGADRQWAVRKDQLTSMKGVYRQRRRSWEQTPISGSHNSGSRLSGYDRCTYNGDPRRLTPGAIRCVSVCVCIRFHLSCLHSIFKRTMHTTRNFTPSQNGRLPPPRSTIVSSLHEHPVFAKSRCILFPNLPKCILHFFNS